MDGCKLNIGLKYIPVKYNVESYESINSKHDLIFFFFKVVYESKVVKKTLSPQYNEDFSVPTVKYYFDFDFVHYYLSFFTH